MGGGPAYPRRPGGRRRRAPGGADLGVPFGAPVPRRRGGHHLAAPHRGQRLPGPGTPARRAADGTARRHRTVPRRAGRLGHRAGRARRARPAAGRAARRPRAGRRAGVLGSGGGGDPRRGGRHGEEPLRPGPGETCRTLGVPAEPGTGGRRPISERDDRYRRGGEVSPINDVDLDRLADYTAGLLDPQDRQQVDELIRTDPEWRHAYQALTAAQPALTAALTELRDAPLPADVGARLDSALAEAGAAAPGTAKVIDISRRRRWTRLAAGTTAAAAAISAGVTALSNAAPFPPATPTGVVRAPGHPPPARPRASSRRPCRSCYTPTPTTPRRTCRPPQTPPAPAPRRTPDRARGWPARRRTTASRVA